MLASSAQTLGGLLLVLGLIFGLAWATRRLQTLRGVQTASMVIEGGLQIGAKERVLMIRAADQHFLIGVTASQVSLLHRFHGEPGQVHNAQIIPFNEHLRSAP